MKEKRRRTRTRRRYKKPQGKNIMSTSATQGGHKNASIHSTPGHYDVGSHHYNLKLVRKINAV